MPTYQYACTDCGHELEAVQSFTDDALTTCPDCGGTLRKLFGNVGVVFKGSGFYRTDSRGSGSSSGSSSDSTPAAGTSSSGASSSGASSSGASSSGASSSGSSSSGSPSAPATSTS